MTMSRAMELVADHGALKAEFLKPAEWQRAMARAESWNMPDLGTAESQASLYTKLSWVHQAVKITARTCAGQRLDVKRLMGEDTKDIPNHEFETKLRRPNELMSRSELLESTFSYRELTGNGYWWLNKPGGKNGRIVEIWVIPSHQIQPIPDEKLFILGYAYDPGHGQAIPLETWEVVQFKTFNPFSQFVGLSFIESIAIAAVGDLEASKWNTELFGENNARLPGILAFADLHGPDMWNKLQQQTITNAKKRNLMMLNGVGKGGVEWMQAAASQKEMEFLAGRQFTKEEIWGNYPGLASMLDVNATEANSKAGKQTYLDHCIWPILQGVSEKITNDVMPNYGDNLVAEFEDPRQVDKVLELQEQEAFAKVHTIDEIRTEYYQDKELGDDRGLLLPAQVGAAAIPMYVARGEEPPETPPQFGQQTPPQEQEEEKPETTAETEPEMESAEEVKAMLSTWRRKAINAFDKSGSAAVPFESDGVISDSLHGSIVAQLTACKSKSDVRGVFDKAITIQPTKSEISDLTRAFLEVANAIREA